MRAIRFTVKNLKKVFNRLHSDDKRFMALVRNLWEQDGNNLVRKIIQEQLSGRPGLNRRSGRAQQAIKIHTTSSTGNVQQRFFIDPSNPAKEYLPIHDKSWRGSRIIKAKRNYMVFKGLRGWAKVKKVKIPQRTNFKKVFEKDGNVMRLNSVNTAMKVFA